MKVLITSGGTMEYVDDVRVLTNISTGKLGAKLAEVFSEKHDVFYLHSKTAVMPSKEGKTPAAYIQANSAQEVFDAMKELVPQMDVVIHAMAVSDFTFDRSIPVKLKSNDPIAFIDSMRSRIKMNPKIIQHVKEWNPNVLLFGFKFEVGLTKEDLIQTALDAIAKTKADYTLANDKEMMKKEGKHVAFLINKNGNMCELFSKEEIANKILLISEVEN
jgi:phosphopantothenate-cysteine ligase